MNMNILVIGQGLAGVLVARALRRRGADVWVADTAETLNTASSIAAGIVNPITGKRYVKSWRFDEFFSIAKETYQKIEQEYGIVIWHEKPILRLLSSIEEANDWSARCAQKEYTGLLSECADPGAWPQLLHSGDRYGWIHQAARVDFAPLLHALRQESRSWGQWLAETVPYHQVESLLKTFDRIVFCEGHRAVGNPFFPDLPWQLAKGEACIVRIDHPLAAQIGEMLKKTMTLVPLGKGLFWCGATFEWNYPDENPAETQQQILLEHLREMLSVPFMVEKQLAAVRPTNKDRRPFLLNSPLNPAVWMLNGLGTKGALLAPGYAEQLCECITDNCLDNVQSGG